MRSNRAPPRPRQLSDSPDYSAAAADCPLSGSGVASWEVRISGASCSRVFLGVVRPSGFAPTGLQENVDAGVLWYCDGELRHPPPGGGGGGLRVSVVGGPPPRFTTGDVRRPPRPRWR